MYALVNGRQIPVESLKSVTSSEGGILISGAAASEPLRQQVRDALGSLKKKDVVSFNVVTSDWRAITGTAVVRDILVAGKPGTDLRFYVSMKLERNPK